MPGDELDRDKRVREIGPTTSYSADGTLVANSWSEDLGGSVRVRDAVTGALVVEHDGSYRGIDSYPGSILLACGRRDGAFDVLNVLTGDLVAQIAAHRSCCYDVAFSPDGTRLDSAGNDNALRLWDTETYALSLEFSRRRSYVRGVAWSPDGTMLASVSGDFGVSIWDSVDRETRYQERLAHGVLEGESRDEARAEAQHGAKTGADSMRSEVALLRWTASSL